MIIKKSIKFVFLIFVPLIFYILLSFLSLLFTTEKKCQNRERTIYLYGDFAHTEILVPLSYFEKNQLEDFPPIIKNRSKGYLAFSYGDREFLMKVPTWDDIDYKIAFKSLFTNTPALIRIGYYWDIKKDICIKIDLSDRCLKKLQHSIFDSFSKKDKHFIRYHDHFKEPNIFYFQAKKSYNLFHTCNSWSGDRLREAGVKASYLTPFAYQVIYPLDNE